jgi:chromate transporter
MIFLQLFLTFLKIGAFNFGGGYAMLTLIQNEVVVKHTWITMQEFTDIVAVSQMTPGPIGINTATYVGYTAVANAGYGVPWAVAGAVLASFSVILIPFVLVLLVIRFLRKHKDNKDVDNVLKTLRLVVVGLIAAAALILFTSDNFGVFGLNLQFVVSCVIFILCFVLSLKKKADPILLLLFSGVAGAVIYGM